MQSVYLTKIIITKYNWTGKSIFSCTVCPFIIDQNHGPGFETRDAMTQTNEVQLEM